MNNLEKHAHAAKINGKVLPWNWYPKDTSQVFKSLKEPCNHIAGAPLLTKVLADPLAFNKFEEEASKDNLINSAAFRPYSEEYYFVPSRDLPGVKKGERAIMVVHNSMQTYLADAKKKQPYGFPPKDIPVLNKRRKDLENGIITGLGDIPKYSLNDLMNGKVADYSSPFGVLVSPEVLKSEWHKHNAITHSTAEDLTCFLKKKKDVLSSPAINLYSGNPEDLESFYDNMKKEKKKFFIWTSFSFRREHRDMDSRGIYGSRNPKTYQKFTSARMITFHVKGRTNGFGSDVAFVPIIGNNILTYKV